MNEQFKAQITYKAREFATAYTNQLFPNEPAFSFGHEGWAKFVDAMVELAGAHPDKGTSALAIEYIAKQWDGCRYDIVGEGFVDIGECIREAGTKFPQAALVEAEALKAHQQAIEAAVLAEREQCARLCESKIDWLNMASDDPSPEYGYKSDAAEELSSAVRARTQNMRIEETPK